MTDKELFCIAATIHRELLHLRQNRYKEQLRQLSLFVSKLQEVAFESKRFGLAISRSWYAAADRCSTSVLRRLYDIPHCMSHLQSILERRLRDVPQPSSIFEELKAAQAEFGDIAYDGEEDVLSVTTEPITLEDVYLGPFRIALYLDKLQEMYQKFPYYIVAVEPNPAAKDESVTHPHVSNEILCEGEGSGAIRAALEEGRLCDFFSMVRSILETYNADSPYVALSDWDGTSCADCGYVMDSEEVYHCSRCNDAVCDNCSRVCTDCGEIVCGDCASTCEACDKTLCPNCAKAKCSECESICCESCINDGLCPNCKEEMENEEDEEQQNEDAPKTTTEPQRTAMAGRLAPDGVSPGPNDASVQPDRLGQAPVLPGQIRE